LATGCEEEVEGISSSVGRSCCYVIVGVLRDEVND